MYLKNPTKNNVQLIFHLPESPNAIKDVFADSDKFHEKSIKNIANCKCYKNYFGFMVK